MHPGMTAETQTFGANQTDAGAIDTWIEQVGRQWDDSPGTVFAARLCVAELANNVIEHGTPRSKDDHIVVTLTRCSDGIGIEFMDTRGQFDPTIEHAELSQAASAYEGGRGLMLIRSYAKDLAYRHDGRYNRVSLKIEGPHSDPGSVSAEAH